MKLQFVGATHGVTGSAHLLKTNGKNILVDYGMRQGREEHISYDLPILASEVDYLLLTHSHIDHSGYIPFLVKNGFNGKIFATGATTDLARIMLEDSAHIQEQEAEWANRKAKRSGKKEVEALYTIEDAKKALTLFHKVEYLEEVQIEENIFAVFYDVGHLLGSAAIQVISIENNEERTIVFSGDVGNIDQPLIKDPQYIRKADYIVCESTYGDRNHREVKDYRVDLAKVIKETFDKGGNVIIPAFAVGRTQELLYFLRDIITKGLVENHDVPVYLDSPLAIEAVEVFDDNIWGYFDDEAMAVVKAGIDPINFPGLKLTVKSDESKLINFDKKPKVIISASGMCDAGRIRHHLKHNLWREESTVVFVGYQAEGSLGRMLLDGVNEVKLFGEIIDVKANIIKLDGISGHADQKGLIKWLSEFKEKPKMVFTVHGDPSVLPIFEEKIREELNLHTYSPYYLDEFDLLTGYQTHVGDKTIMAKEKVKVVKLSRAYSEFIAVLNELSKEAKKVSGYPNKDLNKATRLLREVLNIFKSK